MQKSTLELNKMTESLHSEIRRREEVERTAKSKVQRHQLELAHVSRLNIAGELISGIAHELSQSLNIIAALLGGCILRLEKQGSETEITDALKSAEAQTERAGDLIHSLMEFFRKGELHKKQICVNHLLNEVVDFIEPRLKEAQVKVILRLDSNLPKIFADKIQIKQVLLNILCNAIEAMQSTSPKEKQIIVKTGVKDNRYIQISLLDFGPGVSPDIIDTIFHSFTTTKEKGMGIGLSISDSIITSHDGHLSVQNHSGGGAQFLVEIPIADDTRISEA